MSSERRERDDEREERRREGSREGRKDKRRARRRRAILLLVGFPVVVAHGNVSDLDPRTDKYSPFKLERYGQWEGPA